MPRAALSCLFAFASFAACSKPSPGSGPAAGSGAAPAGAYLTVGTYCSAFCSKLCGTCGAGAPSCADSCATRCHYGRSPDQVMDGKDPKVALALTQANLDACLATITKTSCMSIASGQVPPACYTIQH